MTKLRVFIASPGELDDERDRVSRVVDELSVLFAPVCGVDLEAVRYETHARPGFGADAQDVINQAIEWGEINIFVGMMWRRFGTPTHRAGSGTEEEFDRAYSHYQKSGGRPRIMLYFRRTPFYSDKLEEIGQFLKVVEFKGRVERGGGFVWNYDTPEEFEREVRKHLMGEIREQAQSRKTRDGLVVKSNILSLQAVDSDVGGQGAYAAATQRAVFVSYVKEDEEFARNLYGVLTGCGVRVWSDLNNSRGKPELSPEVGEAIEKAQVVITVLSRNTINSPWILKEFLRAQQTEGQCGHSGYRVIPLLLPGVEPSALELLFNAPLKADPLQCRSGNLMEVLPDLLKFFAG
jgi:hypothetical protein